jgi:hypothetical protein
MRRLIVAAAAAGVFLSGCASHRAQVAEASAPEDKANPRWVQYEWLDKHPVAELVGLTALCTGVAAVFVGLLYLDSKFGE